MRHRHFRINNTFIEVIDSDSDNDDSLRGRPSRRAPSAPAPETRGQPQPRPRSAACSRRAAEARESPDPGQDQFGGAGAAAAASCPERDTQIERSAHDSGVDKPRGGHRQQSFTMGDVMQALLQEDPLCVFTARGVNALGFESEELLGSHYSNYGRVRRVLIAHSKAKVGSSTTSTRTRLRPGSIGFVVMEDAHSARRICQAGREQTVAGKRVRVERFERVKGAERGGASTGSEPAIGPERLVSSCGSARSTRSSSRSTGSSGWHAGPGGFFLPGPGSGCGSRSGSPHRLGSDGSGSDRVSSRGRVVAARPFRGPRECRSRHTAAADDLAHVHHVHVHVHVHVHLHAATQ